MQEPSQDRQLVLFPGEQIAWETLPDTCQHSICQLLSLLIEQVRNQQQQQQQQTQTNSTEENHV